jgi:hypothetical protein
MMVCMIVDMIIVDWPKNNPTPTSGNSLKSKSSKFGYLLNVL